MGENVREIALDSLIEIMEHDKFCHDVIGEVLTKYQYLDKKDRAFYSRIVQGTCENLIYIDYIINSFSKVKTGKMKPLIRNDIRMAVYQIIFMKAVPDSAACNEAVKLAVKRGFGGLKGFVNGVIRAVARGYMEVRMPDRNNNPADYLSVRYSVPKWIVDMWLSQYGEKITEQILIAANDSGRITVRACIDSYDDMESEMSEIEEMLAEDGVSVEKGHYADEAMILSGVDYIRRLRAFREGRIYVQDESSMLVAHIADIKKNDLCLDVCAAPGGKTLHMAACLEGTGMVCARDVSENKVSRIEENVHRCGYDNVDVSVHDATEFDAGLVDKFDVVLCDVPCSGLGVIGHKPDIRYKTTRDDIDSLVKIQRKILENAVKYVKNGKTFIYSTCTLNDYENIENVRWIEENSDLRLSSLDSFIPEELRCETTGKGYLTLIPGVHKCDGFFIAKFTKNNL